MQMRSIFESFRKFYIIKTDVRFAVDYENTSSGKHHSTLIQTYDIVPPIGRCKGKAFVGSYDNRFLRKCILLSRIFV